MIEARGLGKRYGATAAVDDLTFTIRPGMVTGFLGPNGAGKTTTMRLILGLDCRLHARRRRRYRPVGPGARRALRRPAAGGRRRAGRHHTDRLGAR